MPSFAEAELAFSHNTFLLTGSETVLADIALDLLRLLMTDHWSWLCTENMQKVLHLLFSTLIQR